ncbi:hypothetical protein CEXT_299551 [Caerostris extrusa]|uniref:Uncharacterized protein n=1 Tax=Caerostris extrusa TaxID=172846 RepID=A0AAV4S9Y7_CAEEX|nr:hypothetical protein CEXT_299551 [Caerostris extrusa]
MKKMTEPHSPGYSVMSKRNNLIFCMSSPSSSYGENVSFASLVMPRRRLSRRLVFVRFFAGVMSPMATITVQTIYTLFKHDQCLSANTGKEGIKPPFAKHRFQAFALEPRFRLFSSCASSIQLNSTQHATRHAEFARLLLACSKDKEVK